MYMYQYIYIYIYTRMPVYVYISIYTCMYIYICDWNIEHKQQLIQCTLQLRSLSAFMAQDR